MSDANLSMEDFKPKSFDDVAGQRRLVNPDTGVLRMLVNNGLPQSMVFYGSPGTGKTTCAGIIAKALNRPFVSLNATNASTKDVQEVVANSNPENKTVLYLDEIQYFNKKQQQSLLPYVEQNDITLIAATAENPKAQIYDALLSRLISIKFEKLEPSDIANRIREVLASKNMSDKFTDSAINHIASAVAGDMRQAATIVCSLSNLYRSNQISTAEIRDSGLLDLSNLPFDMTDQYHYQLKSALQKSIRGSDPDAAAFYAARFGEAGDLSSPARRMLVIASEDVGLADPNAVTHTLSCIQASERIGFPEATRFLVQAAVYLALAPKSTSANNAMCKALDDIRNGKGAIIPGHISVEHPDNYLYPHNYPNHWVEQQYLPNDLVGTQYYIPQMTVWEQQFDKYWSAVKAENRKD